MFTVLKIAELVLRILLTLPTNYFFWILLIVIAGLYQKSAGLEQAMLGSRPSILRKISEAVLIGFLAGLLGSFLMVFLGITIEDYGGPAGSLWTSGILYIWIIALLLTMINPRYLCFSYAGGIVALANLLIGFPKINVPGIIALIGILHLIESFLIWIDGYTGAVPIFLKRKDDSVIGGYYMNRMWPIPIVLLTIGIGMAAGKGSINMPDWWPIIKAVGASGSANNLMYAPLLVPVVLGYGDMAVTSTPKRRCTVSALRLGGYSVILIILAVLASKIYAFGYAAALFSPIAHELLILHGKKEEEEGKPLFSGFDKGVRVLYSRKGTPACKMQIEPGDIILSINNQPIYNEKQLADFLATYPNYIWLELQKACGGTRTVEYKDYANGIGSLGTLIVPRDATLYFELDDAASPLKRILGYLHKSQ